MNKYEYMQFYTLVLQDVARWLGDRCVYDNDSGELTVYDKDGKVVFYGKSHDIDYDSCALLLKEYLLNKYGVTDNLNIK